MKTLDPSKYPPLLRPERLCEISGIKMTMLKDMLRKKLFQSALVSVPGSKRGVRLIVTESAFAWLNDCIEKSLSTEGSAGNQAESNDVRQPATA